MTAQAGPGKRIIGTDGDDDEPCPGPRREKERRRKKRTGERDTFSSLCAPLLVLRRHRFSHLVLCDQTAEKAQERFEQS